MKIKMLNNETINKIAAGEVIIRPVSVIKELVENAIDADSSRIHIIIEKGGKTSICVLDNGIGIAYNEVALAFKRHATSKLLTIEDLESVETLGFRGEALSSISAVSRVRVTTKTKDEEIGNQSYFEGGSMINQRVCTYDKGTEVLVSDLFYNTPARQKHLQKDKNEEKLIRDILEKLSMSHPEISFSYTSDGREVFKTPGTGVLKDVIESLYGRDFFKRLRPLNIENTPMRLKGYISDLTLTRSTREEQIFFINNRYIRNKNLSRAFEEAYEGYMMVHKHPVGLIFMELPGKMLDINIHPAKTEIQILNESLVNILFKQGIRESLKSQNLVVDAKMVIKEDKKIEPSKNIEEPVTFFEKEKLDFESAVIPVQINGKNKLEDKKVED
ncbi:MAG: DNA mismatch repair endonuclease MutL, partial [Eubacterium sp.]